MMLNVGVGKCHDAAPIVRTVGEIEKGIALHQNSKVGPANTVRVDIHKSKYSGRHGNHEVRMLPENFVGGREPHVPRAGPSSVSVESVTAQPGIGSGADF